MNNQTLKRQNGEDKLTSFGNLKRKLKSPQAINIMYVPVLVLIGVFIFYPFLRGLMISFTNWDGYSQSYDYVGFDKYKMIFTDSNILLTIKNTLIYGLGSSVLQSVFGLAFALLLDSSIKGKKLYRTIIYLPVIISPLIIGHVWHFLFQFKTGALNDVMLLLGMDRVNWLANGNRAVLIIVIVNVFQYVGTSMIIFLAGLQTIPKEFYDAAKMDIGTGVKMFRHITLPLLMPSITITSVLNIIGGLKLFDVIVALTKGGPGYASQSLSTMMYNLYFTRQDAGYASALGNLMFIMIAVIGLVVLKFFRSKEVEL